MEQYELKVGEEYDDNENIIRTSLVEEPATRKLWAIFSNTATVNHKLKVLNLPTATNTQVVQPTGSGFEQIISGVWFMPETDYARVNEEGKIYTARMSTEQLTLAHTNFKKSGKINNFDVHHDGKNVDGLVTVETWQLFDHEQKSPTLGKTIYDLGYAKEDIPLGSVFMSVFVKDSKFFYDMVDSGKVKGFSIEGLFNIHKINKREMNKFKEMFNALGLDQTVGTLISNTGQKVMFTDEGIKVDELDAVNEELKLTSGFTLVFRDGKLAEFGFNEEAPLPAGDGAETGAEEITKDADTPELTEDEINAAELSDAEAPTKSVEDQIAEAVAKALADLNKPNPIDDDSAEVKTEEVDPRDAKIKELQDLLDKDKTTDVKPTKKKLKSIPKSIVKKDTTDNSNQYFTKTVGKKTYNIRKY